MSARVLPEQHLTPAEVCARLRVSRRTLYSLIRPGAVWPVAKLNERTIRVPASSLSRFLAACTWDPKGVAQ